MTWNTLLACYYIKLCIIIIYYYFIWKAQSGSSGNASRRQDNPWKISFSDCKFKVQSVLTTKNQFSFTEKPEHPYLILSCDCIDKRVVSITHKQNTNCHKTLICRHYLQVTWWALGQWKGRTKFIKW